MCAGYIQTPGWAERIVHPKYMNSVVFVGVPPNYQLMLTFLAVKLAGPRDRLQCDTFRVSLSLYQGNFSEGNMFWNYLQLRTKSPALKRKVLPPATNLYLQFRCERRQKRGFRLYFSVHKESNALTRTAGNLWNCSVPHFNDFKLHFPCDLVGQCLGREDEVHCPYTTDTCGLGLITLGDRCLTHHTASEGSWRKMAFLCRQKGGQLASLRSRRDQDSLANYIYPQTVVYDFDRVAIGIYTASSSLPHM